MPRATSRDGFYTYTSSSDIAAKHCTVVGVGGISHILSATVMCKGDSAHRKMLVLVNGNKFKIDRQQHNSTSNFVSANSLIAKFLRYDASSIASLCVNASD